MQTKKSFFEVLSSAWSTFKSSFWGIIATWWFAIVVMIAVYWIMNHIFNVPVTAFGKNPQNIPLSAPVIILAIFNFYLAILLSTWQVLVIKNNIFTGSSNLFPALRQSFLKSLKVLAILAILFPIFIIATIIAANIFPSCAKIIPAIFWLLFVPLVMLPLGVILHDTKFMNAVIEAFGICSSNYFRILGFSALLFILQIILMTLIIAFLFIFKFLMILFLFAIIIIGILFYFMVYPFYACFYVELYLDLATDTENFLDNTSSQEESYPEIINLDLPQEQTPAEQVQLKEEQPQKIYPDEPPEGLQQLGGNYNDKK